MSRKANINWKEVSKEFVTRIEKGEKINYSSLGIEHGVSRERIRQVFNQYKIKDIYIESKIKKKQIITNNKTKQKLLEKGDVSKFDLDLYRVLRLKFSQKKQGAKQRNLEFTIKFGELEFPEYCPVLGIKIDYRAEGRQENSMSWDRIDSSKGYVSGNVVIMSWRANRIKNDGTKEEHQKIVDFLSKLETTNYINTSINLV